MNDTAHPAPTATPDPAAAAAAATTVDPQNPWLGLASFTEETRAYFFGRDEEVGELARRVQRKLLTVLFGQSGLGKTSILRAGLVPRLAAAGYCPVYVRIDYSREAPEPAEQIKRAILSTARRSGKWTQAGIASEGESLWEFLHHRDDVLLDAEGKPLTPLVIFDQFEEIFTLAQSDEFGRARAARFVSELAALVENRPPKALEEDESAAERFDFARSGYRVVIALREDYLAPLEGLKKEIPSIGQNRLRLAPMTGTQALAAVLKPGGRLVTEEVAAAIVRFVAGGAELANAEVEPSLLSLICRELNDARIGQGRSEISLDLLAGSHATILSNFYERSLADQPPAVQRIIEEELLTESGYRESVAEERLLNDFAQAGAAPGTLAVLVNRRLLRIEERLDVRRVELTHDVLCPVVKASRDARHEREAREATDRLLAEQKARELAARRALVRARQVAAACTVLAALALVAAGYAWFASQRAQRAERVALETRAMAEKARGEAEHLLGYLSDDLVRELESFGRLQVLAEFAQRQVAYFHGLPPALRGTETTRNAALAMVYYARAARLLGKLDEGSAAAAEAQQLLDAQRSAGDNSEATAIALALAYAVQASVLDDQNKPGGDATIQLAVNVLKPYAEAANASGPARRAYVDVLQRAGFEDVQGNRWQDAIRTERKAMELAAGLGATDLSDPYMGASYVEACGWMTTAQVSLAKNDEALRAEGECMRLGEKLLEIRPGYRRVLHGEQIVEGTITGVFANDLNPTEWLRYARQDAVVSERLLALDPHNTVSANNMSVAQFSIAQALWAAGKVRESLPYMSASCTYLARASETGGANFSILYAYNVAFEVWRLAALEDFAAAKAALAAGLPRFEQVRRSEAPDSISVAIIDAMQHFSEEALSFYARDFAAAARQGEAIRTALLGVTAHGDFQVNQLDVSLWATGSFTAMAQYVVGDYAGAEKSLRLAVERRKRWATDQVGDQRDVNVYSAWLAMAVAKQGRADEAARIIAPVVKFERGIAARNHGDAWVPLELATALYAESLTDPSRAPALLGEASALIRGMPAALQAIGDVRVVRDLIAGRASGHTGD